MSLDNDSAPASPCRATSTRPSAWPRSTPWKPRCATSSPATGADQATSSTSATACCPRPTPMCSGASSTSCTPLAEPPIGVLLMAYGTPATPADVEAYYTHVRRGRPPTPEQLADLQRRYEAIGGTSPLLERTEAHRRRGQAALVGHGQLRVLRRMNQAPHIIERACKRVPG